MIIVLITLLVWWTILVLSLMHGWSGVAVPYFFKFYTGSHISAVISVVSSNIFCEKEPPNIVTNRRSYRILHRHFYSRGLMPTLAVDQCYVVLSGFMLHSYASYLFSCTTKWDVYVSGLDLIFHTRMWAVYKHFRETVPPWPPECFIIMIGIFMSITFFHSAVLFVSVFQIIAWNFR